MRVSQGDVPRPVDSGEKEGVTVRGVICYYSGSGNTKLACEYLAARVGLRFDLVDVIADRDVDLASYGVVGLAASTDFGGLPQRFETFLAELSPEPGTPAFALNTFGFMSGRTLRDLTEQTRARGFDVIGGHSLRMPESYPPMLAIRMGFAGQPNPRRMRKFDSFIDELGALLGRANRGEIIKPWRARHPLLSNLSRPRPRTTARDDMGEKFVDADLCTECGDCEKGCPYVAVTLAPKPVFDMSKCYGCWRCYNQCPQHAIYTKRFRGGPYYPRPSARTGETLRA